MTASSVLTPVPTPPPPTPLTPAAGSSSSVAGLSFGDVLDAVNPLQHIPVVSSVYRAMTGSSISSVSEVAGDTLYGALMGGGTVSLATSLADVAVKQISGSGIGQHVVSAIETVTGTGSSATATAPTAATAKVALVPNPNVTTQQQAALVAQAAPAPALPLNASVQSSSRQAAQYQRAQAFDALNKKLVGMVA